MRSRAWTGPDATRRRTWGRSSCEGARHRCGYSRCCNDRKGDTLTALRQYLATAFRWQKGRQGTGYDKMLLFTAPWPVPFDSYLLRYPEGSEIPPHTDPVTKGRHYRLNVILKAPKSGGEFACAQPIYETRRIKLFRPDQSAHSVSRVVGGSRYVLSIGWVLGSRSM